MNPNQEDEGQEVSLIQSGISSINYRNSMNIGAFTKWVESLTSEMPKLIEEHQACELAHSGISPMIERYLEDKIDSAIPGYTIIDSQVLTKMTRGALAFDSKVEVIPAVDQNIDMVGLCVVLILYHIDDYRAHSVELDKPYQGRIKVVTLNELFY